VGCQGRNRFHSSTSGTIYQGREHDRPKLGIEESFSEGAWLWNAHAELLHQSRWTESECQPACGTGAGEGTACEAGGAEQADEKPQDVLNEGRLWHSNAGNAERRERECSSIAFEALALVLGGPTEEI